VVALLCHPAVVALLCHPEERSDEGSAPEFSKPESRSFASLRMTEAESIRDTNNRITHEGSAASLRT
jgi:hypothetical protein